MSGTVRYRPRGDTAANWTNLNPVLALRELGFETDTSRAKLGDGITAWNSLGYTAASSAGVCINRTQLAGLPTLLKQAYLTESGREGTFVFSTANHSADVTADPQQGLYVAPSTDTTGASGAWVRKYDGALNVKWFGAKGDGVTDDTAALQAASAIINANSGGTLILEAQKTYLVGTQVFAGTTGKLFSYAPLNAINTGAIDIKNCTKPVVIEGRGAKIVNVSGYKYGSFDPTTGAVYNPTLPFTNADYQACMLDGHVRLENNTAKVVVRDLESDGRASTAVLGGFYGDAGRQIPGTGIWSNANDEVVLENVHAHDHPLDGWIQGWTGLTLADGRKSAFAINCSFIKNSRQGLSWVGGNGLTAISCKFNETGRGTFESAPGAGVDIEAEASICRNGHFIDCEFTDNFGAGLLHGGGDVADVLSTRCTFIGTTNFTVWPDAPRMTFDKCTFVGSPVNTYTSADPGEACKFYDCFFTADTSKSPTGQVYIYETHLVNLGGGDQNVLLDGCRITTGGNMAAHAIFSNGQAIFRNVTIHQDNVAAGEYGYPRGFFHGTNILDGLFDFSGTNTTQNYGHLVYNGTVFDYAPQVDAITPPSGTLQINGQLYVANGELAFGKNDFSGPTNELYWRTGGAFSTQYYFHKKLDGTTVQTAQTTAVGPDYAPLGYRVAGLGGVCLGTLATYNVAQVTDTSLDLLSGVTYKINGTQVVGARKTGWTAPTGTALRTGFDTSTATLTQVAQTLKALIDDLHATAGHGLVGA